MSRGYELFVEEAGRVVNSPYPTQLKQLHTIVCQNCSDADISSWAAARPCHIDALARNLLDALQHWPYVLDIITKLCTSLPLRDAFVRYDSNLLFETVSRAVSGSWKHNAASIAMLSHPLPPNITLPAACQNLFLGIVDHAALSPSSASMKPVYLLLRGGLGPLLGLLSYEVLSQIEDHFLDTLQNTIGQEDQCLSLYCFSVMKTMVTVAEEDVSFSSAGRYETQELLASTPNSPKWKPEGMQKFFSASRKAHKALHLIVLRVLYSTQITDKDAVGEVIECLGLANQLVQYLPESVREAWCAQNPLVVQKLQERALQPVMDTGMQLQAFAFFFSLCRSQSIPDQMIDRLSHILSTPTDLIKDLAAGDEPPMARFASVLSSARMCDFFIMLTRFALSDEPAELMNCADTTIATIRCLTTAKDSLDSVSAGAVAALGSSTIAKSLSRLQQMFRNGIGSASTNNSGVCSSALLQTRKEIVHSLSGLFLKAALTADHSQTDVVSDTYPMLIELHALSSSPSPLCGHVKAQPRKTSLEMPSTVASQSTGSDWREALNGHLQSKAQNEHSTLMELFAHACEDLEMRCSDVETPLREESEKRAELQKQYEKLSRKFKGLEDEKGHAEACMKDLEAEREDAAQDLEEAREQNIGLIARAEELEETLHRSREEAKGQLASLKSDMQVAEMQHAASLAGNQEQLEELESKLNRAQGSLDARDREAQALHERLEAASSASRAFESERQAWSTTCDWYKRTIKATEQAKDDLSARSTELLSELDAAHSDLAAEKQSHEENLAKAQREAFQRLDAAKSDSNREIAQLHERHHSDMVGWKEQMIFAQKESRRVTEDSTAQISKRDKKLADCLKKVEHLKGVCQEKDEQIAEANAMRLNLMAAMGLGKQHSQATNRRTTRSAAAKEAAFDDSDISIPFMDTLASLAKPTEKLVLNDVTQDSQADPSPKGAKPRKSIRAISPSQARISSFGRTVRNSTPGQSAVKRQPLLSLSANRSPGKAGAKTPSKHLLKSIDGVDDDTMFDGSEVFASTQAAGQQAGDGEVLPDDDTMLE